MKISVQITITNNLESQFLLLHDVQGDFLINKFPLIYV